MFKLSVEGFLKFFTTKQQREDTYKDPTGKGLVQRFMESNWQEWDDYTIPYLEEIVANTLDASTCFSEFIAHLESWQGVTVFPLESTESARRKILGWIARFYDVKGTRVGFESLFNMLDLDVAITESFNNFSFDSPVTFDDPIRTFDMSKCSPCSDYFIELTPRNPVVYTAEYLRGCYSIIKFNHPVGARLRYADLDGTYVQDRMLALYVAGGGTATDITNNDGYYTFLLTSDIIPSNAADANLEVANGTLYLNIPHN